MSVVRIEYRGEFFVTLASAAEAYRVELRWVEQVYAHGLLGPGARVGAEIALSEAELDRLASIVRWHQHYGLELDVVAAFCTR